MSKDFKEKYERVCQIKDRAISLVETQLNGNIENVDAAELGEVADIAKDMAELMELCAEAEYYHAITEAMEKNSDAENLKQMDKYLPESRYYDGRPPIIYANGNNGGNNSGMGNGMSGSGRGGNGSRYYMPMDDWMDDMYPGMGQRSGMKPRYYTEIKSTTPDMMRDRDMGNNDYMRDVKEGRSGMTRKTYMDMKEDGTDKATKMKEMEKYLHDLADDITEMINGLDANEKAVVKQKMTALAAKIA